MITSYGAQINLAALELPIAASICIRPMPGELQRVGDKTSIIQSSPVARRLPPMPQLVGGAREQEKI